MLTDPPPAPTLVFAWGNPSRGDDALGPLFLDALRALNPPGTDLLGDYQLQPEHSLDLVGRERVLFADASVACETPFELTPLQAERDRSYTSHALSPQALLAAYDALGAGDAPDAYLLSIRGYRFELGEDLSEQARLNLDRALAFAGEQLFGQQSVHWAQLTAETG